MTQDNDQRGLVARLSKDLTGTQRRYLRSMGHSLNPIVLIGQRGISENLLENVEAGLLAHELIKVKAHDADILTEAAEAIAEATDARLVQQIGKTLLFYREHPDDPKIRLPND